METVRSSWRACFRNFEIIQAMLKTIRLLKNKTSDGVDVNILRKYINNRLFYLSIETACLLSLQRVTIFNHGIVNVKC